MCKVDLQELLVMFRFTASGNLCAISRQNQGFFLWIRHDKSITENLKNSYSTGSLGLCSQSEYFLPALQCAVISGRRKFKPPVLLVLLIFGRDSHHLVERAARAQKNRIAARSGDQ